MEIGKWKLAQAWIHHPEPKDSRGVWNDLIKVANAEWKIKERDQMAEGGTPQLVQPGPGRPGYSGEPWRIKQQAKNIKAQKDTWNKIGDAMWKANETGDMEFLMNKGSHKKGMMDGSMRNSWQKLSTNEDGLRHIAKEFNMDVDRVLDLMEEKKDFDIESKRLTFQEKILAKSSKLRSQFAKGEKWMMANGHRFNDPAKFKAAYIKRFGNGNAFIKAIKTGKVSLFSPKFNAELLGAEGMIGQGSKLTKTLGDNIFSSVIYNMNDKVRNAITTEFERALTGDVPTVKYQARKILTQSPLLKKFGLDKKIHGPISRLIFKEIGDKMYENIQTFRQPRATTLGLLKYLEDVVDPKYKSAISEARKAADYATRNKWKDAKKALNISDKINWDHKVPSFLIDAGYADKLEYAKLQPTTENFNMKIKNAQFDRPMANLMEEWKKAPASQKGNVITKMQDLKNNFSRKYGGYMRDVTIAPDKTGKPIFTSQAGPFTKKTDVVKSLKTSLAQEKGFKSWRAKVNAGKAATLAKALELKGIKICQKGIVKKESGGRIGFAGKCGTALAADNPNLYMKLAKESTQAQDLFKSGKIGKYLRGAKSWTLANMGPAGWIGGELLIMGLGTLYETSQGKGWKEGLDTWTGLGGHFGMAEERLKEIGKEQGWSDQQVYDAMKIQKLLALSQEGGEKEWELEGLLEQQDIGGTARVKYDSKPTQGQYQDPQYLRDLKEEVPGIWEEGDALYKSLMNPQTSSVLLQELQDRKKYEELVTKNKIWGALKKRPFVGQQLEAPDPSDPGPFERSPGHPGYTGAFTKWKPDFYADGGIASLLKK